VQEETEDRTTQIRTGLTAAEVEQRVQDGRVNAPDDTLSVTMKDIVRENVCTYFNLIFLILTICLCAVGSFRNLTFLPLVIGNTLIGIFQEWRSKSLLDKLTLVTQPKVKTSPGWAGRRWFRRSSWWKMTSSSCRGQPDHRRRADSGGASAG